MGYNIVLDLMRYSHEVAANDVNKEDVNFIIKD